MTTVLEVLLIDLRDAQHRTAEVTRYIDAASYEATPQDVRDTLAAIQHEFAPTLTKASGDMAEAEAKVRAYVLEYQEGGKAGGLEATYTPGRVTWDTKALDKAVRLIPGLVDYRKIGDPYCTIRKAKDEARDSAPGLP